MDVPVACLDNGRRKITFNCLDNGRRKMANKTVRYCSDCDDRKMCYKCDNTFDRKGSLKKTLNIIPSDEGYLYIFVKRLK